MASQKSTSCLEGTLEMPNDAKFGLVIGVTVVIAISVREQRVVLTEDRDFGRLVYASAAPSTGVIPLRYPTAARATLPSTVAEFVASHSDQISRRFVVIEPGRARIGGSTA